jgi:hypothetical protein
MAGHGPALSRVRRGGAYDRTARDLFDAAEGFYEALPVIGGALRAVKRRL